MFFVSVCVAYALAYYGLTTVLGNRYLERNFNSRLTQRRRREGLFLLSVMEALEGREDLGLYVPPVDEPLVDVERWPTRFEQAYTKQQRNELFEEYMETKKSLLK